MPKKLFILFAIVLFLPCKVRSQVTDFDTWVDLELKGKLFKLVDLDVNPELRLWNNSTQVDSWLCEIEASVPIVKYFQLGLAYRYQLDVTKPNYNQRVNRFGVFAGVSYKLKRLKIAYKAYYYQEYTNMNTSELGYVPQKQHRHKLSLKYNIKKSKFTPYAMAEMGFTFQPEWKNQERKFRGTIGLEYKIYKHLYVSVDYKYQQQFYNNNPKTDNILGIGMEYDL
jgi:hypothetical protein